MNLRKRQGLNVTFDDTQKKKKKKKMVMECFNLLKKDTGPVPKFNVGFINSRAAVDSITLSARERLRVPMRMPLLPTQIV